MWFLILAKISQGNVNMHIATNRYRVIENYFIHTCSCDQHSLSIFSFDILMLVPPCNESWGNFILRADIISTYPKPFSHNFNNVVMECLQYTCRSHTSIVEIRLYYYYTILHLIVKQSQFFYYMLHTFYYLRLYLAKVLWHHNGSLFAEAFYYEYSDTL